MSKIEKGTATSTHARARSGTSERLPVADIPGGSCTIATPCGKWPHEQINLTYSLPAGGRQADAATHSLEGRRGKCLISNLAGLRQSILVFLGKMVRNNGPPCPLGPVWRTLRPERRGRATSRARNAAPPFITEAHDSWSMRLTSVCPGSGAAGMSATTTERSPDSLITNRTVAVLP